MKITCPFCKTEYNSQNCAGRCVECACCGHVWSVRNARRSGWLVIFASIVALMAAAVFATVIVIGTSAQKKEPQPIVAEITMVRTVKDAYGDSHYVVSGSVKNVSDKIYGIPDIEIIIRDDDGNALATQRFMAPAPLLDAGEVAEFSHTIEQVVSGAKKVSVEFKE